MLKININKIIRIINIIFFIKIKKTFFCHYMIEEKTIKYETFDILYNNKQKNKINYKNLPNRIFYLGIYNIKTLI